ncbi:callose synthase 7-like [Olea europaea subsp. europaea]|uniref:Callose synthase 7-like n=1 Tax=Olea europaea subsp. europaea TaxID=158383 RepID=A0A8S0TP87_OLEEU|nr:callose synthase 7-like [Olea europaea subsp. europaea]
MKLSKRIPESLIYEKETERILAEDDSREIQKYFQMFYRRHIREGQYTKKPEEMAKIYQIANVLYDVIKALVHSSIIDDKTKRIAKDIEEKREQHKHYTILPLDAAGVKSAIMEFPDVVYEDTPKIIVSMVSAE